MAQNEDVLRFLADVDAEDLDLLREVAARHGAEIELIDVRDIGVVNAIFILGALVTVQALVRDFMDRRDDRRRGGQVIDLRQGRVLLRRDPELRAELLVVVASDGSLQINVLNQPDAVGRIAEVVLGTLAGVAGGAVDPTVDEVTAALEALPATVDFSVRGTVPGEAPDTGSAG